MPPTKEDGGRRKHNTLLLQVQIENSDNSSSCGNTFGRGLEDLILSFSYDALKDSAKMRGSLLYAPPYINYITEKETVRL